LGRAPSALRLGYITAQAVLELQSMPQPKQVLPSIEILKLGVSAPSVAAIESSKEMSTTADITDRKNKRFFKKKERQAVAPQLSTMIAEIKLKNMHSVMGQPPAHESAAAATSSVSDVVHKKLEQPGGRWKPGRWCIFICVGCVVDGRVQ
jgi:hypothetical protein